MFTLQTIKSRIIALAIVLVTIGASVRQFVALPIMQDQVQELVASQQMSIATYVARDIDHSITERRALIAQLAADLPPDYAIKPERLRAWLKERQRFNPLFNKGLMAVRPDGNGLIADYPITEGRGALDFSQSEWFAKARQLDKPVISRPIRGKTDGAPIIVFAAPVRDADGRLMTVLAGVVLLSGPDIFGRLQETKLGTSGGFLLVSPEDKMFVAATDPSMILKPTPPPGVNLLHDRAMAGYRGTGVTVNAKGVEELSAMVTVPSTGWFVVARMPTEEAFRPIATVRSFSVALSAAVYGVVFSILVVALTVILRPLTAAARAMRDMADGKAELAPLPVARADEVGKLVKGFNYLVDKLRKEETARKAGEAQLEFLAHHDSLTGLYNRAILEDHLEQALARAGRSGQEVALLFCDLDGFKAINDQYGHDTGDALLRQIAQRLISGRRRTDTVARLGGDEFLILLPDLGDARMAAKSVAEQCLDGIAQPFEHDGQALSIGMSIGIAVYEGGTVTPSYLMSKADIAMYRAKSAGKGRYFFIDDSEAVEPGPSAATETAELLERSKKRQNS